MSDSAITAKELELSDANFEIFKEAARIVKEATKKHGEKIYECEVEDLFFVSKIMRMQTGSAIILSEYIDRYFKMRDKKFATKSFSEFLLNIGCGTNAKVKSWKYPNAGRKLTHKEIDYLAKSNQESVSILHSVLPEEDKAIFLRAFMKRYPFGLPSNRSMRYYCKFFPELIKTPEKLKSEFRYIPVLSIDEQIKWCQFFKVNKDFVMSWMGTHNGSFADLEKILLDGVSPEDTKVAVFYRILESLNVEQRCFVTKLYKNEEVYKRFLSRFMAMASIDRSKEYVADLVANFPLVNEITEENIVWHFVSFAYPESDMQYVKIFGCSKFEFAEKFPFKHVLTQALLGLFFGIKTPIDFSQHTKDCAKQIYDLYQNQLSKNTYFRRKFTELGAGKILAILDSHKSVIKNDTWAQGVIDSLATEQVELFQTRAW